MELPGALAAPPPATASATRSHDEDSSYSNEAVSIVLGTICCLFVVMIILIFLIIGATSGAEDLPEDRDDQTANYFTPPPSLRIKSTPIGQKLSSTTTRTSPTSTTRRTTPSRTTSATASATPRATARATASATASATAIATAITRASTASSSTAGTTTSATMSTTPRTTTTTTAAPMYQRPKPPRNFTLICSYDCLKYPPKLPVLCTDYVHLRLHNCNGSLYPTTFAWGDSPPCDKMESSDSQTTWHERVAEEVFGITESTHYVGMWGQYYYRIIFKHQPAIYYFKALRKYLSQTKIVQHYDGFAILNNYLRDEIADEVFYRFNEHRQAFKTKLGPGEANGILPKNFSYMHSVAVWPRRHPPDHVKALLGEVDVAGISTHNSTGSENDVLGYSADWSSPPNPIGDMMSTLDRFPGYKRALGGKPLCFSVSAAVNYIRRDKSYITRLSRSELCNGAVLASMGSEARHEYDDITKTHFFTDGHNHLYFEERGLFRQKVKDLLNKYPNDKCIIFDGLDMDAIGDDNGTFVTCTANVKNYTYEFRRFELLTIVYEEMVERYGEPFPASELTAQRNWPPLETILSSAGKKKQK